MAPDTSDPTGHEPRSLGLRSIGRRTGVALMFLVVVAGAWVFTRRGPGFEMPVYQGQTAEQWFHGDGGHPGLQTTMEAAEKAFAAMGTNCIPFLLAKARTRDSALERFRAWLYPKLPRPLRPKRSTLAASYIQMIAYRHLRKGLERSSFMAEEILASIPNISDDIVRSMAFEMTKDVALRTGNIEQKTAYFSAFLHDRYFIVQLKSAVHLATVDPRLTNGLPILVNAVTNGTLVAQAIAGRVSGGLPPSFARELARRTQEEAREALEKVAPDLARRYRIQLAP